MHHYSGPRIRKISSAESIRSNLLRTKLVPAIIPVSLSAASKLNVLSYLHEHTNREFNVEVDWPALCESGQAVVLFDGLDEVPLASRQSILERVHRFDARYEKAAWCLTVCDSAILTGLLTHGFSKSCRSTIRMSWPLRMRGRSAFRTSMAGNPLADLAHTPILSGWSLRPVDPAGATL